MVKKVYNLLMKVIADICHRYIMYSIEKIFCYVYVYIGFTLLKRL